MTSALQKWVADLTIMQQSVLISAIRGPDGIAKLHKCKPIIRWYRRCILLSAFERTAITDPWHPGGGSFTGPTCVKPAEAFGFTWETNITKYEDDFVDSRDELPFHYILHFIHAIEIIGYKHPDTRIKNYFYKFYLRLVTAMHLTPETCDQMDFRLSDSLEDWMLCADKSTTCSD